MDHNGKVFQFLQEKRPEISVSKRKKSYEEQEFRCIAQGTEKAASEAFKVVVDHFRGKHKALI